MIVRSSILLTALFAALCAFGLSGVAFAESPSHSDPLDSEAFSLMTGHSLDMAFEKATSPVSGKTAPRTSGPTHMQCKVGAAADEAETCVVTAEAEVAAVPAAMAPR